MRLVQARPVFYRTEISSQRYFGPKELLLWYVCRRAVFGSDSNLMRFEFRVVAVQGTSAMQKAVRRSCLAPIERSAIRRTLALGG